LRTLSARIAEFTQADTKDVARAVDAVLQASDASIARRIGEEVRLEGNPEDAVTWSLLSDASASTIDARAALLEGRTHALEQFILAVKEPEQPANLHRMVPAHAWIVSPLLDLVPRRTLRDDDAVAVIEFERLRPILECWTIACWAVGTPPGELESTPAGPFLTIASSPTESLDAVSWEEALHLSREAHMQLLATSERP
jgi:hypothetical protein